MSSRAHGKKSSDAARVFLSFVLFIFIVLSGLSVIGKQEIMDTDRMIESVTDYSFVSGVRDRAITYAEDRLKCNGLSTDNIEQIYRYDLFRDSIKSFAASKIQSKRGYSQEPERESMEQLRKNISDEIITQLKQNKIKYTADEVDYIVNDINEYNLSLVEINGADKLKAVTNVGPLAFAIASVVTIVISVILALMLFFTGSSRYRSLRFISISFLSAALLNFILSGMIFVVGRIKTVDLYPDYLQRAFYGYADNVVMSIAVSGVIFALLSAVISTFVWKMKREEL